MFVIYLDWLVSWDVQEAMHFLSVSFSEGHLYPGLTPGVNFGGMTPHGWDTRVFSFSSGVIPGEKPLLSTLLKVSGWLTEWSKVEVEGWNPLYNRFSLVNKHVQLYIHQKYFHFYNKRNENAAIRTNDVIINCFGVEVRDLVNNQNKWCHHQLFRSWS